METLPTFHQITLDFVEKRGRPKSIAFCRKMWFFKVSLAKKWRLSFMTQFLITMMTIVKRILFGYCDPQKVLYVANSFSLQSFAKLSLVAHRIEASIMTNGFYCFFLLQFRMRLIFFCQWVGNVKRTGVRNSVPPTQMGNVRYILYVNLRKNEKNIKKSTFCKLPMQLPSN